MEKVEKVGKQVLEKQQRKNEQKLGIPKTPARQVAKNKLEELKQEMKDSLTPLPQSKRKPKTSVVLHDNVDDAREQVEKFRKALARKQTPQTKAVATVQLENAQKVLDLALKHQKETEIEPVRINFDDVQDDRAIDDGRAIPVETRAAKRKRLKAEKEAEERAKAQQLAQEQEQLARQQAEEAGEQEQKGEGKRRRRQRKHHKKGGMKKAQSIDNEHKARLKALFK